MARKKAEPIRRGCVWCGGSGPWSDEHAIAQWISELMQARFGIRTPNFSLDGGWYDEDEPTAQPTKRVQLKLEVCRSCNSGWMSDLEQGVKNTLPALIFGDPILLTDDDSRVLAAWAMKTLINLAFMEHRQAPALYPVPMRDHLREKEEPPGDVLIVAARVSGLEWKLRSRVQDTELRKPGGSHLGTTVLTTTLIHAVAFQMMSHTWGSAATLTHGAVSGGSAIRLWPVNGSATSWPTSEALDPDSFDFFADPPADEVHSNVAG